MTAACAEAERVFCCVGVDYTKWLDEWPLIIGGVLAGCRSSGAALIWLDNLYCYGPQTEPLKEDMPLTTYGRKPALRARMVRQLYEFRAEGGKMVIVRASDFYGPGVRTSILGERTIEPLVKGRAAEVYWDPCAAPVSSTPRHVDRGTAQKSTSARGGCRPAPHAMCRRRTPHAWAYAPDVARALQSVADAPYAYGRAWHVPNAEPQSQLQVVSRRIRRVQPSPIQLSSGRCFAMPQPALRADPSLEITCPDGRASVQCTGQDQPGDGPTARSRNHARRLRRGEDSSGAQRDGLRARPTLPRRSQVAAAPHTVLSAPRECWCVRPARSTRR